MGAQKVVEDIVGQGGIEIGRDHNFVFILTRDTGRYPSCITLGR
jgi:hypothetical protein